jgi:hypothetical protein
MSKSFQVPEPVTVPAWAAENSSAKPATLTFLVFATTCWLNDPQAILDAQGKPNLVKQKRWFKVIDLFEASKPGDWITLDDEDYATLVKIVQAPATVYPSLRVMQAALPFSEAVLQARKDLPAHLLTESAAPAASKA